MNLTHEELFEFFTELQGLVRAGVPLGHDLDLSAASDSRRVQRLWDRIHTGLEQGQPLSETLRGLSPQIGEATRTLIRAGEESGDLFGVLGVIAQGHRRRLGLERTLKISVAYPMVVFIFTLGVLMFFGAVIIPTFQEMLPTVQAASMSSSLGPVGMYAPPRPSPMVAPFAIMEICLWLASPIGIALTLAVIVFFIWFLWGGGWLRPWVQTRILAWLPLVGHLMNLGALARWSHTLGHLLERRVSMDTALLLAEPTLELHRLETESVQIREQIERGIPLSAAMMSRRLLPRSAAGLLALGEQRGDLDATLMRLADHCSDRLDYQIRKIEVWLEPVLILFTGLIVLTLIISLYAPLTMLPRML